MCFSPRESTMSLRYIFGPVTPESADQYLHHGRQSGRCLAFDRLVAPASPLLPRAGSPAGVLSGNASAEGRCGRGRGRAVLLALLAQPTDRLEACHPWPCGSLTRLPSCNRYAGVTLGRPRGDCQPRHRWQGRGQTARHCPPQQDPGLCTTSRAWTPTRTWGSRDRVRVLKYRVEQEVPSCARGMRFSPKWPSICSLLPSLGHVARGVRPCAA
jgi:hypothetical protein